MCKLDHALEVSVGLLPIYNTICFYPHAGYRHLKIDQEEETYDRGRSSAPVGGPSEEGGLFAMTGKELSDNLSFLSALKMLEGLAAAGKLTNEEKEKAREELERRLRPTLLFA